MRMPIGIRVRMVLAGIFFVGASVFAWAADDAGRVIPRPLEAHPGNVFVDGEEVRVPVPEEAVGQVAHWRVLDDQRAEVASGAARDASHVEVGALPVGWYRVEFLDAAGEPVAHTTAAVLATLKAPVPEDSPICVDVAMSWLEEDAAKREALARLAALAGVNGVRDRVHWREIQTGPDTFVDRTKYDDAAALQAAEGLKILQVFHTTPTWAHDPASDPDRPRTDLRHLYAFCRHLAERFEGRVQAWEPWNEGNAHNFGGRTMDELCTHQKAAYLGFKAGDPGLTVAWNPLGGANTARQAEEILRNETWPYYDVYSIHSYDWAHAYEALWRNAREASAGRPIWVTECDRGMKAMPDSPWADFEHNDAILKAEFIVQSYASSLFAGASRHYHFILGHYVESNNRIQFGLLRKDHTPRPSYVALAAMGRLLAGGQCLGRWAIPDAPEANVVAFRAQPDGEVRDVLVAWAEKEVGWPGRGKRELAWTLPPGAVVETTFDYLGRPLGDQAPDRLTSSPVFIVLEADEAEKLALRPPPRMAFREGLPSPIVLQLDTPGVRPMMHKRAWTEEPERVLEKDTDCVVSVYNFGKDAVSGTLTVEISPEGWRMEANRWDIQLGPMGREDLSLRLLAPERQTEEDTWITIRGDFGTADKPVLAFRVCPAE